MLDVLWQTEQSLYPKNSLFRKGKKHQTVTPINIDDQLQRKSQTGEPHSDGRVKGHGAPGPGIETGTREMREAIHPLAAASHRPGTGRRPHQHGEPARAEGDSVGRNERMEALGEA